MQQQRLNVLTGPICFLCKVGLQLRNSTHTVKVTGDLIIQGSM